MNLRRIIIVGLWALCATAVCVFGIWKGKIVLEKTEAERPLDTITFHGPNQIIQFEGRVTSWGSSYVGFRDAQGIKHGFSPPFTIEFGKEN